MKIKKLSYYLFLTISLFLLSGAESKACHAIALVNFNQQNPIPGGIQVTAASDSPTCGCTDYWLDLEVRCMNDPWNSGPFNPGFWGPLNTYPFFQSAKMLKPNCVVQNYPWITIPYNGLCPGVQYKYRMRENHNGQVGPWTPDQYFTVPGVAAPLVGQIVANTTNICSGNCANLTASVTGGCNLATTYTWNNGLGTGPNKTVCPPVTTTYTVTITEACSNTQTTVSITINVVPPAVAGTVTVNPNPVCFGTPVTLTLTGSAGNVQWQQSTNGGGTWTNIVGGTTTVYNTAGLTVNTCFRAAVTGCNGTVYSNMVCVTVNPLPTVNVNNVTICAGQSATLTATPSLPGGTYLWSPGGFTTQSITVSPGSTTTYTVTYTLNGCTGTGTGTVTVNPQPTVNVNSLTICAGQTATLTATPSIGGGTYSWSPGGFTTQSITVSPGSTTTYTVTYTLNGCVATGTGTVTVNPQPTVNVNNVTICAGQNATLTATPSIGGGTYLWTPGNLTTPSITVSPGSTTTYTVTYTLNGCVATGTGTVTVNPQPTVNVNSTSICNGQNATLTATPSVGGGTYFWTPGSQTTQSITVSPGSTTTYTVTYTLNGCVATGSGTVTVTSNPTVTVNNDSICSGQTATLTATPSAPGGTYAWVPGGFNTQSINVSPGSTTTYTVTYDITGCIGTGSGTVTVFPQPAASFNAANVCFGTAVAFNNTTIIGGGGVIASWNWNFGDGNTSTSQNPSHNYAAPGTYTVTLTATSTDGCVDTYTTSVTVHPEPVANFTYIAACDGFPIVFNDQSSVSSGSITQWQWNFGDGSPLDNNQNTSHTYPSSGTYNVTLTVTTNNGCTKSVTIQVTVLQKPIPAFTSNNVCFGLSTSFQDQTSPSATSWYWNFGDGNSSTAQNPSHTYAAPGTYTVKFIASLGSCLDSITQTVTVHPLPQPSFTYAAGCPSQATQFNNTSTILSGTITGWNWSFPSGTPSSSTAQNPSTTYPSGGTYNVTLVATSNNGCVDSITQTIVIPYTPVANFSATTVCVGTATCFSDLSNVQNGNITTWQWVFGDGSPVNNQQNPCHTYANAGTYTVTLIVTSNSGCAASATINITVNPNPVASFTVNNICRDNFAAFNNTSTGATTYSWAFGNGATSTSQNPTYQYPLAGAYNVTLIANSGAGCADTVTLPITVYPEPVANFNFVNACDGNPVNFTDASTIGGGGSITQWNWNFGNSNTSTQQNPSETYANDGSYLVTLIVTTADGCTDTISKLITVYPLPVVDFTPTDVCLGTPTQFTNLSTVSSGTNAGFSWQFGNGGSSSQQNPIYTYNQPGTYNVTLTVTTNYGCTGTVTKQVIVHPNPTVNFAISDTASCSPVCVNFFDLSTITGNSSIVQWNWDFSNGTSSTQNPSNCFTAGAINPVSYTVKLVVTTNFGCVDSVTKSNLITAYPNPVANFEADPWESDIFRPEINFTDISAGASKWLWNFGDGQTSVVKNPKHLFQDSGTYTVSMYIENQWGCSDTISKTIRINPDFSIFIPNAFTPDGDGVNDSFGAVGYGITEYNMYVFDRWGELIFESHKYGENWNGFTSGKEAQVGVYPYRIDIKDINLKPHSFIGHVNLVK